jgi:hypothetical protein
MQPDFGNRLRPGAKSHVHLFLFSKGTVGLSKSNQQMQRWTDDLGLDSKYKAGGNTFRNQVQQIVAQLQYWVGMSLTSAISPYKGIASI